MMARHAPVTPSNGPQRTARRASAEAERQASNGLGVAR